MSEFTDIYRARQDIRWRLRKIKRKASPDVYWKLKGEEEQLSLKLDEIIKREKDDSK
jgi:hypothetical protein